jgi:hypothetical protein
MILTKGLSFNLLFEDNTFIFAQARFFIVIFHVFSFIEATSIEFFVRFNPFVLVAFISKSYDHVELV